ncbi:MAG: hypothetical protein ACREMM_05400 [Gemmatimonadales bacterium]
MGTQSTHHVPEALRRHNLEQQRDPELVINNLRRRVPVVVLWRQRDGDRERWIYLERMLPEDFSMETVKQRWGGGAYRIRLFGPWDRASRQERYITQVAFWIWHGFPPTPALQSRLTSVPR